jgi:hypothetical protein
VLNTSPSLTTPIVDSLNGGQLAGMRNRIINGDMRISQRGTSFASGALQYSLDRWQFYRNSSATGATAVATTSGSIPGVVLGSYAQMQRNSGDTNTNAIVLATSLESINIRDLAGKTVTLSFYGYCNAATVGNTFANIQYGTGTDGNIPTGFTGGVVAGTVTLSGNASWIKNTLTVTLPSNATQLGLTFFHVPTGTAGGSDFFGISFVQLELGSVATPFEQRPIGLELSLCQRYLPVFDSPNGSLTAVLAGQAISASTALIGFPFKTPSRVPPTGIIATTGVTGYNLSISTGGAAQASALTYNSATNTECSFSVAASSMVPGNATMFGTNAPGKILFTGCEL